MANEMKWWTVENLGDGAEWHEQFDSRKAAEMHANEILRKLTRHDIDYILRNRARMGGANVQIAFGAAFDDDESLDWETVTEDEDFLTIEKWREAKGM